MQPLASRYAPSNRTSAEPALGRAPLQTSTVRASLRHKSVDSVDAREDLGCHLGQGLRQSHVLKHKTNIETWNTDKTDKTVRAGSWQ